MQKKYLSTDIQDKNLSKNIQDQIFKIKTLEIKYQAKIWDKCLGIKFSGQNFQQNIFRTNTWDKNE